MNSKPSNMLFRIALLLCFTFILAESSSAQLDIKTMTYNIRYQNKKDGVNAWANRKEKVAGLILKQNADVVGLQEALASQVEFLDENLSGYERVGVGRE